MRSDADETGNLTAFFDANAIACFDKIVVTDVHIFGQVESLNVVDECGVGYACSCDGLTIAPNKRTDHAWSVAADPTVSKAFEYGAYHNYSTVSGF